VSENKPPKAYREIYQLLKSLQADAKAQRLEESADHEEDENPS